jgi:ABC-type glycerol-3-phosphate transport system substrate-binding protein
MVAFGLLALFGLFMFANFKGFDNGQAAVGNVVIWGVLPEEEMSTQLDTLRSKYPEYAGVTYVERPLATFGPDLAEALAISEGPDLILISQEQLVSEQNKLTVIPYSRLSQRTLRETFVPITELFLTDKGTYGIPFAVDPLVMYYNRTLLGTAGIPQPPTTWEAVLGMAERLIQRTGGQITRSLIAFGEYDNVPNARALISLLLLQSGSLITEPTTLGLQATLSSDSVTENEGSPESAITFYTQFSDPAKPVYSWNRAMPDARQAFLAGDLALYFGYVSELPALRAGNPNLDFDMAPVPQPQRNTVRTTYGRAYAFAIPKASKNGEGAYATALALAGKDMAPEAARLMSMVPASRGSLMANPEDRYEPVYFPEALVARGWLSPSPAVTDSIFTAMIGNITTGRRDPAQAIFQADQALDAAL